MVEVIGSIVAFIVALLIGGLAIYISARIVTGADDYSHAIITALLGAIAWALTAWIPLIGPIIALIAWIAVINWRYRGGWINAIIIGVVAWLSAIIILYIISLVLNIQIGAFGVPGI